MNLRELKGIYEKMTKERHYEELLGKRTPKKKRMKKRTPDNEFEQENQEILKNLSRLGYSILTREDNIVRLVKDGKHLSCCLKHATVLDEGAEIPKVCKECFPGFREYQSIEQEIKYGAGARWVTVTMPAYSLVTASPVTPNPLTYNGTEIVNRYEQAVKDYEQQRQDSMKAYEQQKKEMQKMLDDHNKLVRDEMKRLGMI